MYFTSQKAFFSFFLHLSLGLYVFLLPFHDSIYDIIRVDMKILKSKKISSKKRSKNIFHSYRS